MEERTVEFCGAVVKRAGRLVQLWCESVYQKAERAESVEIPAPTREPVDLDELFLKFWMAWAHHPLSLSIVNDVMFFFGEDVPDRDFFKFEICASILPKECLLGVGKANFWAVKAGDVLCKESFAFTNFKGDPFLDRKAMAFAILKSLVKTTRTWAPLTQEDSIFWDERLTEILEERSKRETDPFAKDLARDLLEYINATRSQ